MKDELKNEILSKIKDGYLPKVNFGKGIEVKEQKEYFKPADERKYPSKEELKKVHLQIIDKLHGELSEAELYWLAFVVDDDTKSGRWAERTNSYI